jgi:hypothetical protein
MTVVRSSLPPPVATTAAVAEAQAIGPFATTADGEQAAAMTTDSTLFWEAKDDAGRGTICEGGGGEGEGTTILVCNNKNVADGEARIGGGQVVGEAAAKRALLPELLTSVTGNAARNGWAAWNGHSGAVL